MTEYTLLKLIHLGAFVFWLGPPLGAWLAFKIVERSATENHPLVAKVNRLFFFTVTLEHIAFLALLISGFTLAIKYQLLDAPWLNQKLHIVLFAVLPLELIDIVLGNWLAKRASNNYFSGVALTPLEHRILQLYHGAFTKAALVTIPVTVVLIMVLAIGKTPLGI